MHKYYFVLRADFCWRGPSHARFVALVKTLLRFGKLNQPWDMPAAIMSPAEWAEIRSVVESGMAIKDVANQYDVPVMAIYKRAERENWITPPKLEKAIKRRQELSKSVKMTPPAMEIVAKSIAEKGEMLRATAIRLSQKGLDAAVRADLPVESWQDAKLAWEIGAKAAGLDKGEGASVTVLFGAPPEDSATPAHVQEAEVVDVDDLAELE